VTPDKAKPRGRQTRVLRKEQIDRLEKFRRAPHDGAPNGYSLLQLKRAMSAPFTWETLRKALQGLPVWDLSYFYIASWIDRYLSAPPRDGKTAAAGRDSESNETPETEAETTRIVRGSR
jgi:hypothetical protein